MPIRPVAIVSPIRLAWNETGIVRLVGKACGATVIIEETAVSMLSEIMFNALIISYLFLGGMGAGSFFVLVIVWVISSRMVLAGRGSGSTLKFGYRSFLGVGFGASLAIQVLGISCLLADLKRPEALMYLVVNPQPTAITVGAYALAILVLCTLVLAVSRLGVVDLPCVVEGISGLVGAVGSCVVMVYTALLLKSCVGNPFWSSSLIPVLFVLSSLSTGIAYVVVVSIVSGGFSAGRGLMGKLLSVDFALGVAELVVLAFFVALGLLGSGCGEAYDQLIRGSFSEAFWIGLVGFGLVIPIFLGMCSRCLPAVRVSPLLTAFFVMVGGACLRYCIVGVGVL